MPHLQFFHYVSRVERSCTSIGDQSKIPRITTARDCDFANHICALRVANL